MLNGIHPLLHADLLYALAAMGHGDEMVIADANFPAASLAPRLVQSGASAPAMLDAILTLFPIDTAASPAAFTMEVSDDETAVPDTVRDFAAVFTSHDLADIEIGRLERQAFYERARHAFMVVRTPDLRPYGNILLVKGTVNTYPPLR